MTLSDSLRDRDRIAELEAKLAWLCMVADRAIRANAPVDADTPPIDEGCTAAAYLDLENAIRKSREALQ